MPKELSPESIYLLVSLLHRFREDSHFEIKVEDIVKEHYSTRNTVNSLLKKLESEGCLETEKTRNYRGKGRGPTRYRFTEKMEKVIESTPLLKKFCEANAHTMARIIDAGGCCCGDALKGGLRSSNRLFLLILVLHSDEMGVVSNLGTAEISRLMGGISKDRFKSQLATMVDNGLVRAYVPGITGAELFGKVKAKYYLNVYHPLLTGCYPNVSRLTFYVNGITWGNMSTEADALFGTRPYNRASWPRIIARYCQYLDMQNIYPFLKRKSLASQYQLKLFELASVMLSENMHTLAEESTWCRAIDFVSPNVFLGKTKTASLMDVTLMLVAANDAPESITCLKDETTVFHYISKQLVLCVQGKKRESNQVTNLWSGYLDLAGLSISIARGIAKRYQALINYSYRELSVDKVVLVPVFTYETTEKQEKFIESFEVLFTSNQQCGESKLILHEDRFEISHEGTSPHVVESFENHEQLSQRVDKLLLPW
ncbi:hypothetical protein [Vibrio mediterranei]|uniref:hypothetical protein n=1 Tax=Vibrio mediterranei TaxID=689 RepID=UPI00148C286D|nr:hypothetical protein [Vibrio mediterranei]NOI25373.1 hypothetical protein [Vibrio mediterranei]